MTSDVLGQTASTRALAQRPRGVFSLGNFSVWLALVFLGQLAALLLIDAGPAVRYHHFILPWDLDSPSRWIAFTFFGFQTIAVLSALRGLWPKTAVWIRQRFSRRQLMLLVLALFVVGAVPSRDARVYSLELIWVALIHLVNLATIIVCVSTLRTRGSMISARIDAQLDSTSTVAALDRFAVLTALAVVVAAVLLSILVYHRHPHVPDEVVYLYHARYFARGMLTMPAPPVPAAFDLDLMQYEPTRWFSPVPPGWPAILSIGVLLGVPWLVNPVLAGGSILLTFGLVREIYNARTARLSIALLATSPWFLFLAMSFMSHTATLFCALLAAYATARLWRSRALGWAIVAGVGTGLVGLIRPLEGLIVALVLGGCALAVRGARFRIAALLLLGLSTAATVLPQLPYNRVLTGNPFAFPINAYTDKYYGSGTNALGFGPQRGLGWSGLDPYPGHGVRDVAINSALNFSTLDFELLGWSTGSLILLMLLIIGRGLRKVDAPMLAALTVVPVVHSFYWFSGGPDFGPRYWFLMIVPAVVLSARGIELLSKSENELHNAARGRRHVVATVMLLITASVLVFIPWRSFDKYRHYRGMRADVRALSVDPVMQGSLVLVQGRRHPDFASAAVYNPIDLKSRAPVFAWDRGPAVRAQLRRAYPDRAVWILEGPTRTGAAYRLVSGPLSWAEVITGY
jgi:4-amino-4-deoxy-L-arabinose transferase-like glycosyltransferase